MTLGEKIRYLRLSGNLTQEELADRCELSKGFISQMERDMTSPSIATLTDILSALGSSLPDFFQKEEVATIVFSEEDYAIREDRELKSKTTWLIPNAQKNQMEPVLMTIHSGGRSFIDNPHEGEEFGYVLKGAVDIYLDKRVIRAKQGDSFYYRADRPHELRNPYKQDATVIWVATPPTF